MADLVRSKQVKGLIANSKQPYMADAVFGDLRVYIHMGTNGKYDKDGKLVDLVVLARNSRQANLVGRVVQAGTGAAISGATITADITQETKTTPDGRYVLGVFRGTDGYSYR